MTLGVGKGEDHQGVIDLDVGLDVEVSGEDALLNLDNDSRLVPL